MLRVPQADVARAVAGQVKHLEPPRGVEPNRLAAAHAEVDRGVTAELCEHLAPPLIVRLVEAIGLALGFTDMALIGSIAYPESVRSRVVALVSDRLLDLDPIVTHHFPAGDFEAAIDLMDHRRGIVAKIVLEHLERRRAAWTPPERKDTRGYRRLYEDHVLQANLGCDLDFLRGRSAVVADAVTYL